VRKSARRVKLPHIRGEGSGATVAQRRAGLKYLRSFLPAISSNSPQPGIQHGSHHTSRGQFSYWPGCVTSGEVERVYVTIFEGGVESFGCGIGKSHHFAHGRCEMNQDQKSIPVSRKLCSRSAARSRRVAATMSSDRAVRLIRRRRLASVVNRAPLASALPRFSAVSASRCSRNLVDDFCSGIAWKFAYSC
jgi:hypothetical protein